MSTGVQADRISRTPAVQPVPLAVHPHRAGAQHRAGRRSLGRLAGDHRRHVAVTALPGVARRQDHEPGAAGRILFDRYFHRTARLEADQTPPALGGGSDGSQAAGESAQRQLVVRAVRPGGGRRGGGRRGRLRRGRAAPDSASLAISGATDMSAVNGTSFVGFMGLQGPGGDNGQLRVVVSDNTKDRTRAASARRHPRGHRGSALRGLAWPIAYTAGDCRWRYSACRCAQRAPSRRWAAERADSGLTPSPAQAAAQDARRPSMRSPLRPASSSWFPSWRAVQPPQR